jgi:hypothetical protein
MLACPIFVVAQEEPLPFPGKEMRHFSEPGMPRHMGERFEKLSEEEKAKVRKALDQAWQKTEVREARQKLMNANDEFRKTLRDTVQGIDPEAVAIMDKIRPEAPQPSRLPMPKADDPQFAEASIERIGKELSMLARPERREAMQALHVQILAKPEIAPLVQALKAAPTDQRLECFRKLHDAYRKQAQLHFAEIRKEREAAKTNKPVEATK